MRLPLFSSLQPHFSFRTFSDIPFSTLPRIRALVVDRDGTLTPPCVMGVLPSAQSGWETCLRLFPGKIIVVSNSAGLLSADPDGVLASQLETLLHVPVLRHTVRKPHPDLHAEILRMLQCEPGEIAVIGDRLMTDIVLASGLGAMGVHVSGEVCGLSLLERVGKRVEDWVVPRGMKVW